MERTINYLKNKEKIIKFFSESEDIFKKRIYYIRKLEKKNIKFKEAEKYSKIWSNIKFKECKYQKKVYLKIISFDK